MRVQECTLVATSPIEIALFQIHVHILQGKAAA